MPHRIVLIVCCLLVLFSGLECGEFSHYRGEMYATHDGLPGGAVLSIFRTGDDYLWIGTNRGLLRFDGLRFGLYDRSNTPGMTREVTRALQEDRQGVLWIGTFGGVLRYGGGAFKIYTTHKGLSSDFVQCLYLDRTGRLWCGTSNGLNHLEADSFVSYVWERELSGKIVSALAEDDGGRLLVGTIGSGLYAIRDEDDISRVTVPGLPDTADIRTLYRDPLGGTWIGTRGHGLVHFKDGEFRSFTRREGLETREVRALFRDAGGALWVGTGGDGVFIIRGDTVSAPDPEQYLFLRGRVNAVMQDRDGCIWLGTDEGLLRLTSTLGAAVADVPPVPPVRIEELLADGRTAYTYPAPEDGPIVLAPGTHRLTFGYTALSFRHPRGVRFKYKLDGFDETWLDAGTHRRVSYTGIGPGDYVFRVAPASLTAGAEDAGGADQDGARLVFTLQPYFYQTWWFRGLLVVLFALISYLVVGLVRNYLKLHTFWKKKSLIASYRIEGQLGVGGIGVIYRARSLMDKRRVYALKVLREEFMHDDMHRKRFKNESLLVDRIDNPHIVKVHERGEHEGRCYMVMELLVGETLAQRYRAKRFPGVDRAIHIMMQVARVLAAFKKEGIIHRDLKPENIMLIDRDQDPDYVKLLDFGIARVQCFKHLTESGEVVGTIPYMPPEVLSDGNFSSAVDIYSLGVIGYEMLAHRKPFFADTPIDLMKKIVNDPVEAPETFNPAIPGVLSRLVLRMIHKNPHERPDPEEVLTVLSGLLPEEPEG